MTLRNIKLTLEYDGTDFFGWQVQSERRTVQGVVQESLRTLLQEPVKIIGAGRTDAGVHAVGQVASFTTQSKLLLREIHRGLNSLLPADVVTHRVQRVPEEFHARYAATGRRYLYRFSSRSTALRRRFLWTVPFTLDLPLMRSSASKLLGMPDFSAFCLGSQEKVHCRCTVQEISLKKRGDEVHLNIAANRVLHAMVRIIMARLIEVGRGRLTAEAFGESIHNRKVPQPILVAPPQGLCLLEVMYPRSTKSGKGDGR